ncbi:MAG: hypothetical protein KKD44_22790 [Proteobacteria bacterium]|nr:hypothetical protein [Pseudomonadota bacterium]
MMKNWFIFAMGLILIGCGGGGGDELNPPAGDMSGTWYATETVSGCDDPPQTEYETFQVVQSGNTLTVTIQETNEVVTGLISASTVTWNFSRSEDGGTSTIQFSGTLSDDGLTVTGTANWQWTNGSDTYTCSGTTQISAQLLQTADVNVSGHWSGLWYSSNTEDLSDSFTVTLVQNGTVLSGTINVPYIGIENSQLTGTVTGTSIVFGDIDHIITFQGTTSSIASIGTYDYSSSTDIGTWVATKTLDNK